MKKSELKQIIKEEINKKLNESKYQVVFISYSDEEVPYTEQYFDSYEKASAWVDGYETYEYEEVWNSASQDYEQEKVFNYYNPQDKQVYSGYDIKQVENI